MFWFYFFNLTRLLRGKEREKEGGKNALKLKIYVLAQQLFDVDITISAAQLRKQSSEMANKLRS